VRTSPELSVPEYSDDTAIVKVVVPHPVVLTDPDATNVNIGMVSVMESFGSSATLRANVKVSADGAVVTGFTISSALTTNAGVGTATAIDVAMAVVSEMSVA
jgi:hypothetical protein